MGKNSERRVEPRYGVEIPAQIRLKDNIKPDVISFNTKTKDISSSGAFLEGSILVEVGNEMEIRLEIPLQMLRNVTSRSARLTLSGEVVRVSGQGFALLFKESHNLDLLEIGNKS